MSAVWRGRTQLEFPQKLNWLGEGFLPNANVHSRILGSAFIWQNRSGTRWIKFTPISEEAFICLHSLTVIHHFCESQIITSMLYTPCFFYLTGMPWWEYRSYFLAQDACSISHELFRGFVPIVAELTLSWLSVISSSVVSSMDSAPLYSVN